MNRRRVIDYYSDCGLDYSAWSRRLNMHFGFYRFGMNPFRLEAMLDHMTREVVSLLDTGAGPSRLLDVGCGVGTPAHWVARRHPNCRVTGVTIVPWQIERATARTAEAKLQDRVSFVLADYHRLPFPDESFDGIYAIESACYSSGLGKSPLLGEIERVLRPGGRVAFADGFLKRPDRMGSLLRGVLNTVTDAWAFDTFAGVEEFDRCLGHEGLAEIRFREAFWNIVPSALHIPWVTAKFLLSQLIPGRERLGELRRGHVLACVLAPLLGAARHRFGYYLVSARKPENLERTSGEFGPITVYSSHSRHPERGES